MGLNGKFVVPTAASNQEITKLWKRMMEIPDEIEVQLATGNGLEFFWGYQTTMDTIPCTLRTSNMHGGSCVFPGPDSFKADQISRILNVKVPPIEQCHVTPRGNGGAIIQFDGEAVPLEMRILRQHLMAWNLEGRILEGPIVST
jgi:hypothetical protein